MGFFSSREETTEKQRFHNAVEGTLSDAAARIGQQVINLEDDLVKYKELCDAQANHIKLLEAENNRFRNELNYQTARADRMGEIQSHLLSNLRTVYSNIKAVLDMPIPERPVRHDTKAVINNALKVDGEDHAQGPVQGYDGHTADDVDASGDVHSRPH